MPYTFAEPIDLISAPNVVPSLALPAVPFVAYNPLLAKYVKLFSHSTLTPFVIVIQSTPGVMNVAEWKSILASLVLDPVDAPSIKAPLPASP